MPSERLIYLFKRFAVNDSTKAELQEFYDLIGQAGDADVRQLMDEYYAEPVSINAENVDWDFMFRRIINNQPARVIPFVKTTWRRIAVAASIILAVCSASYFIFFRSERKKEELAKVQSKDVEAPKQSKAIITLSDGRKVSIDSLTSLTQNSVSLVKTAEGKIVYSGNSDEIVYNTLSNPRGSKVVDMQLSDGSHVWLNAGSSVTYPVAFAGNDREVSITGEAYFEVMHDAAKPFFVTKGSTQVQVLGTHFNVNAYDDESEIKVTLLQGSVKVSSGNGEGLLKPEQQAVVPAGSDPSASLSVVSNINVEEVMAWKNGLFNFEGVDLKTAMRQLERWYDITVLYEGDVPAIRFGGEMSRDASLSEVLEMLKDAGVHFRKEEGRRMVVMP